MNVKIDMYGCVVRIPSKAVNTVGSSKTSKISKWTVYAFVMCCITAWVEQDWSPRWLNVKKEEYKR